ncbi:MAG: UPF0175 family protein [Deltaproteobacteria bacterium]|nr:UPF0175 family protein [Deltaproteobacteria bacterium]
MPILYFPLNPWEIAVFSGVAQLLLEVPESASLALGLPPDRLANTLLMAAAAKLYESGRLSSGAAADLAGVSKPAFIQRLAEFGADCFRQTAEELREELANA